MSGTSQSEQEEGSEPPSISTGTAALSTGAAKIDASAHYTVMARRFRPQKFGDVIGQQHVAQALRNAIENGRVAQAYLFTGARGVGKTSMARILAKALNCPNVKSGDPCNECEICQAISAGHDVDVSEIDGASNRGIDDIRQLRANVNVKSMRTKYKMYIIDEVHMLTKEAFNALLKTLEEPPPSVKFVFCTTEPNKVPDTILSRCQRFDFSSIATVDIATQLAQIAATEGMTVEPAAIELVARRAAGSMRDSQSLFDQLLAFGHDPIRVEDVHRLLGTADDDRLFQLVEALRSGAQSELIERLEQALSDGVQLEELVNQLLNYLRDLMVLAVGARHVALLSVSEDNRGRLGEQAKNWGLHGVLAALEILAATKTRMFRSSFARALAETALVRISLLGELRPLDEVIRMVSRGTPAASPGRPPAKPQEAAPRIAASKPAAPVSREPAIQGLQGGAAIANARSGSVSSIASSESVPDAQSLRDTAKRTHYPNTAERPADAPPPKTVEFSSEHEVEFWTEVLSCLDDKLRDSASMASAAAISGPNHLELTFPRSYSFNKQVCERGLAGLEAAASKVAQRPVSVVCRLEAGTSPAKAEPKAPKPQPETPAAEPDAFVEQVKRVFNAK